MTLRDWEVLAGLIMSLAVNSGGIAYLFRLGVDLEVLKRGFEDRKDDIDNTASRLVALETVLGVLKELVPELRRVADLTTKMDVLIETALKRLDILEDSRSRQLEHIRHGRES